MEKNRRDIIIEATIEQLRKLYDDEGWSEYYTFNKYVEQHKKN